MCQVSGQAARKRVESMKKLDVPVEEDRKVPEESLRHFFKAIICQIDKICEKVAIKQTITKSLKKHQKRC